MAMVAWPPKKESSSLYLVPDMVLSSKADIGCLVVSISLEIMLCFRVGPNVLRSSQSFNTVLSNPFQFVDL